VLKNLKDKEAEKYFLKKIVLNNKTAGCVNPTVFLFGLRNMLSLLNLK